MFFVTSNRTSERETMHTSTIFSLPPDERYLRARRLVGQIVVVEVDRLRDGRSTKLLEGELVSVAISRPSDVVVVRPEAGPDEAVSLAQIRSIENPRRESA